MRLGLYSVLDEKAQAFQYMFFRKTHGEAIRFFSDAARDPKTAICQHYQDYALYYHGSFDDETGIFDQFSPVQLVSRASEFQQPMVMSEVSNK